MSQCSERIWPLLPGKERNRLLCSVHTGQTGNFPLPDAGKFLIEYDLLPTKCAAEGSFTKNPRSKDRGSAIVVGKRLQRLDLVQHLVGLADRSGRCLEFGSLFLGEVEFDDLLDTLAADHGGNTDTDV